MSYELYTLLQAYTNKKQRRYKKLIIPLQSVIATQREVGDNLLDGTLDWQSDNATSFSKSRIIFFYSVVLQLRAVL